MVHDLPGSLRMATYVEDVKDAKGDGKYCKMLRVVKDD